MRKTPIALLLLVASSAFASANLDFFSNNEVQLVDPASKATFQWSVYNFGDAAAASTVLTMPLPAGARFIGGTPFFTSAACSEASGVVTCSLGSVPAMPDVPRSPVIVSFDVFAPNGGGVFDTIATLTSPSISKPLTEKMTLDVYRDFTITSNADSGQGTLRQMILDTNAICLDAATCRIHFDLGASPATITPLTPLPAITSLSAIFSTDMPVTTPIDTPRKVSIDGSKLTKGDGLVITTAGAVGISGLNVHHFPWNGIVAFGGSGAVSVSLSFADDNGMRGVALLSGSSLNFLRGAARNNRGSGIYVSAAGAAADVAESTIAGNGASGIFSDAVGALISLNTIVHNGQFGVAITKRSSTYLLDNSISQNGVLGVDRGLDFRSINDPAVPNAPTILDATYDASTNSTVVRMRWDATPEQLATFGHIAQFYLYANTTVGGYGQPEAERKLEKKGEQRGSDGVDVIRVDGDLRGQVVTAYATIYRFGDDIFPVSTELSSGMPVQ
jgi:hypothetical protein